MDSDPNHDPDQAPDANEFAELLQRSEKPLAPEPRSGDKLTGTLILIGEGDSFVDCGGRSELPIATEELRDEEGKLRYQVGDSITAHVQSVKGEKRLTLALNLAEQDKAVLERAYADGTPLAATVTECNKGGFSVDLGGRRAFCPYSQIDLHRIENPEELIGRKFTFRVIELSDDGRNVVLSRRVLLQEERDRLAAETRNELAVGAVFEGRVTRLMPYGAFVDIGGIEGLVHISELSYERISDPGELLQTGQTVRVKVLEIRNPGQSRQERISLSVKALAADPWPQTVKQLQIGSEVSGKITRLMDYGAFVELQPGVEGLIHISEMAQQRIRHPKEIVQEGEEVTVRILDVDVDRRRISLSLKEATNWTEPE